MPTNPEQAAREVAEHLAKRMAAHFGEGPADTCKVCMDILCRALLAERRAAVEECARLHENINPASDDERLRGAPGAGAMGAVIEYRDAIRALAAAGGERR